MKIKIQNIIKVVSLIFGFSLLLITFSSLTFAAPQITPPRVREEVQNEENVRLQERLNQATGEGKLEEKIQQIREAVKEKVREKIQEVKKGVARAYVGKIAQIGENEFTLENPRQSIRVVVGEETKIIGKTKQNLEFKDLKVGDFCIAMGYLEEKGTLEAKRIIVIPKPKPPARVVAFGRVTDISSEEKILTVKNERKGITYTITVTDKTIITKKKDNKVQKVQFLAIEIGDRLVAVGTPTENENKIITAKIIHVIPGKAIGTLKPSPSPSPTP